MFIWSILIKNCWYCDGRTVLLCSVANEKNFFLVISRCVSGTLYCVRCISETLYWVLNILDEMGNTCVKTNSNGKKRTMGFLFHRTKKNRFAQVKVDKSNGKVCMTVTIKFELQFWNLVFDIWVKFVRSFRNRGWMQNYLHRFVVHKLLVLGFF